MTRSAYLAVCDVDAETGGPALDGWTTHAEAGGWYTLQHASLGWLLVWRGNTHGIRGLFAVVGPEAVLVAFAAEEPSTRMPAREAWRRKTESAVRAWLRRWRVWRIDGQVRDAEGAIQDVTGVRVDLIPEGAQIPDPTVDALPWMFRADGTVTAVQAEAQVRVTVVRQPALLIGLAGMGFEALVEDEPDRDV